jgi:hypothetical protein
MPETAVPLEERGTSEVTLVQRLLHDCYIYFWLLAFGLKGNSARGGLVGNTAPR